MKRIFLLGALVCMAAISGAQEEKQGSVIGTALRTAGDAIVMFDKETMLDSLDQEKLPKLVSGGVFAGANMNDFLITRDHHTMASHRRVGAELGGFLDFTLTKHFAIQPQVIFTAHQNYFAATDTTNQLWSFGMDVPIYFLGRYGNLKQGYVQFGGGIFTHFTFASNVRGKYTNVDEPESPKSAPAHIRMDEGTTEETTTEVNYDYSRLYSLHNNHFGVCAMVGYEFSFGLQINVSYKISLSDIAGFYSEMKGKAEADALIYPHSVSLCIGYRFK